MLFLAALGVFAAIAFYAFQTGSALARLELANIQAELDRQSKDLQQRIAENARLQQSLTTTQQAATELQARYDADVPSGALAGFLKQLKDKVAAGLPADRIAKSIDELQIPRACEERILRKRVEIAVPGHSVDEGVSFLDGLIQVSVASRSETDFSKSTVTITRAWTSRPTKLTGLPTKQAFTLSNMDLTLTVDVSDLPGYAQASLSICGKA